MKQRCPLAVRFDASLPSLTRIDTRINTGKTRKQVQYPLVSLPLYLIERLETIAAYYCENPAQAHES